MTAPGAFPVVEAVSDSTELAPPVPSTGQPLASEPAPSRRSGRVGAALTEPRATYRIQLTPQFGFDDLTATLQYLAQLGVSHV